MLNKHHDFLEYLTGSLNKYFASQAPYIKCRRGCAKCCSNGDYPFSELEVAFLKEGFKKADISVQNKIRENISNTIELKSKCQNKAEFRYVCPFLINNECAVYDHRGIICRTFGLIYIKENAKQQIPFCAYEGLNYSNILDKEKDMLSAEKMQELGIKSEPKAYNIHYDFLTSDETARIFGINFGKKTTLIDLLTDEKIFYSNNKN